MWEAEENLKTGKFLGKLKKTCTRNKKTEMLYVYTHKQSVNTRVKIENSIERIRR